MTVPAKKPVAPAIGIIGCKGRVGGLLVAELQTGQWSAALAGGTIRSGAATNTDFFVTDQADALITKSNVIIDFTRPEVTAQNIWLAAKHKVPYVTGTTGLSSAQEKELRDASAEIPIVYAANMSVGVTLLAALVEQAAAKLGPDWDVEVLESHHRNKIDAPSGTALMLGKATGRAQASPDRSGKRETGTVGYAVRRGGDIVGEHTVGFYGMGERVELSHLATDRCLFARGAIKAALWVVEQKPGLYSMRDVLGL
jgi:4-hydroxy-tetrahydrodipicolinate reductase